VDKGVTNEATQDPGPYLTEGLRRFAEYAPIHFGITDPNQGGTFLAWNRVSEQMFGYSREEAVGTLTARDLHASEEEFIQVLREVDQGAFDGECQFRRKDGSTFPGRLRVVPVVGADGHIIERCGFIEDLTASKKMLAELEQERGRSYHEDRIYQMGRLSGVIAHDVNNVLSGILVSAQMVSEELGADHPCSEDLQTIEQAVEATAGLMRKLLVFTGRQVTMSESLEVTSWLAGQRAFLSRLLSTSTEFIVDCRSQRSIQIDPNDLQQVLINLLVNGDKAMPAGGRLSLRTYDTAAFVKIEVEDCGVGIPEDMLDAVFQPFFTTRSDGTGLGLSTARDITERAGGTLSLRSQVGEGTRITMSFPADGSFSSGATAYAPASSQGTPLSGQVLVVDDRSQVREPLARAIRRMGLQVQEADSFETARQCLQQLERLSVLVVDSKLTDGAGEGLVPEVRGRFPTAKCILISGYLPPDKTYQESSFDAQLAKPFSLPTLRLTLTRLLAESSESP